MLSLVTKISIALQSTVMFFNSCNCFFCALMYILCKSVLYYTHNKRVMRMLNGWADRREYSLFQALPNQNISTITVMNVHKN